MPISDVNNPRFFPDGLLSSGEKFTLSLDPVALKILSAAKPFEWQRTLLGARTVSEIQACEIYKIHVS